MYIGFRVTEGSQFRRPYSEVIHNGLVEKISLRVEVGVTTVTDRHHIRIVMSNRVTSGLVLLTKFKLLPVFITDPEPSSKEFVGYLLRFLFTLSLTSVRKGTEGKKRVSPKRSSTSKGIGYTLLYR